MHRKQTNKKPSVNTALACRPQSADDDTSLRATATGRDGRPPAEEGWLPQVSLTTALLLSPPPVGLSDHGVLLVPGAFLTRAQGASVSPALAQFFSLEKAPVSKFEGAVEVSLQTCLWQCQEETVFPAEGLRWEGSEVSSQEL